MKYNRIALVSTVLVMLCWVLVSVSKWAVTDWLGRANRVQTAPIDMAHFTDLWIIHLSGPGLIPLLQSKKVGRGVVSMSFQFQLPSFQPSDRIPRCCRRHGLAGEPRPVAQAERAVAPSPRRVRARAPPPGFYPIFLFILLRAALHPSLLRLRRRRRATPVRSLAGA